MNTAELIEPFRSAVKDPAGPVRQWKAEHGSGAVGFLLTDVPEELIHAAGFFPFGITGGSAGLEKTDAHLQTWACSYVRSCLALALGGELDFLDGLIIPQSCDTTRMLSGIWAHASPLSYMDSYRLPRQADRASARNYLVAELERLKRGLEQFGGRPIDRENLRRSISLFNHNRRLFRELFDLHAQDPSLINNRDLYTLISGSMIMPRERVNELLAALVADLKGRLRAEGGEEHIRLVLSGTLLEPLETLDFIDEQGGAVVGDDFQNGYRYIEADVPEADDIFGALADRQLNRIPSAAYDIQQRPRRFFLADLAGDKRAHGVVFLHLKFCEPENFDYYDNLRALESAGIPAMRIETQFGGTSLGQLRTRVHAFLEMMGGESR